MRTAFFILCLTISALSAQAQNKKNADSYSFRYKYYNVYEHEMFKSLQQSTNDFHFRYSTGRETIVNVWKNNDSLGGTITNYIQRNYGHNRRKQDAIIQVTTIDTSLIQKVYELVSDTVIWNLPSMEKIKGWDEEFCGDCATTQFEYKNQNEYQRKRYKYPRNEIPEGKIINTFNKQLESLLQLNVKRRQFEYNLPKRGCYLHDYSGVCPLYNSFLLGYSGSARLPLGYSFSLYSQYIPSMKANIKTNFGISVNHRFNTNNSYDFSTSFRKNLFDQNNISYEYRQRKSDETIYRNHKIHCLLAMDKLSIGTGFDFLSNKQEIGGMFNISYRLPYKLPSIALQTSIFKQHIDYKIGLSKSFRVQKIREVFNANVFFERFEKRNDVGVGLSIYL
ncbi:MAG: hypothetical protein FWC39_12495 [Bacteroidetes bacterium]|nr:hypothetical protein [Bacteroidota bacterium]MCL2329316.1 hypothetical protein [Bacteroidota bacterium]